MTIYGFGYPVVWHLMHFYRADQDPPSFSKCQACFSANVTLQLCYDVCHCWPYRQFCDVWCCQLCRFVSLTTTSSRGDGDFGQKGNMLWISPFPIFGLVLVGPDSLFPCYLGCQYNWAMSCQFGLN